MGINRIDSTLEVMMNKKLTRSITDRKIAGVCGGIAEYFGIDSNLVRILWVLFALGGGSGLIVYIICALLIPEEPAGKELFAFPAKLFVFRIHFAE